MGRKNITSKRIAEILNGKLLRFTDLHNEYKKRYRKVAYKQIADNLKLLQQNGIVSEVVGHYCLTDDLVTGKFKEKQIQLARKRDQKLRATIEKLDKIADADIDIKFLKLIAQNDHNRIRSKVKKLEEDNKTLALALQIKVPNQTEWDRERIRKKIAKTEERITKLNKILQKGVFACELEKFKYRIEIGYTFDRLTEGVMEGLDQVIQENSLEQIEKTLRHFEEQIKTGEEWVSTHDKTHEDYPLAQQLFDLTLRLHARLKGEKKK